MAVRGRLNIHRGGYPLLVTASLYSLACHLR